MSLSTSIDDVTELAVGPTSDPLVVAKFPVAAVDASGGELLAIHVFSSVPRYGSNGTSAQMSLRPCKAPRPCTASTLFDPPFVVVVSLLDDEVQVMSYADGWRTPLWEPSRSGKMFCDELWLRAASEPKSNTNLLIPSNA